LLNQEAVKLLARPLLIDAAALDAALDPSAIVATRVAVGGAAPGPMRSMLAEVAAEADALAATGRARLDAMDQAEQRLVVEARRVIADVEE
jgi:argininosuccinate lyase